MTPPPSTRSQLEDLRVQLRVLQAIGYNTLDEDGDDDGSATTTTTMPSGQPVVAASSLVNGTSARASGLGAAGSLEALLLSKNRHLEHELTMAKLRVVDVRQEADAALAHAAEVEGQLLEQVSVEDSLDAVALLFHCRCCAITM